MRPPANLLLSGFGASGHEWTQEDRRGHESKSMRGTREVARAGSLEWTLVMGHHRVMPLAVGAMFILGLLTLSTRMSARPPSSVRNPDRALRADVQRLYAEIGQVLGWQLPPLVFTTRIPNAASDGARVLVNVGWVRRTLAKHCHQELGCGVAAIVGVLVHELTHHFHGDAQIPAWAWQERRARERRADFLAGFVIASLGLELAFLERVLGDLDLCCDLEHDPPWERVLTLQEGARQALVRSA